MKWLAEKIVKLAGWQFVGELPNDPQFIAIGAPHTSNWDFIIFLAAIRHWDIRPRYLGKHTLFGGPLGWLFRRWGGIPVDRTKPGGLVGQVKAEFEASASFALVIAPEGTRSPAPYWKSGFLSIASATDVPVVPASIDAPSRTIRIGEPIRDTSSVTRTMNQLRTFYRDVVGIKADGAGPVRVREEDSS